jgi:hypothetical protein
LEQTSAKFTVTFSIAKLLPIAAQAAGPTVAFVCRCCRKLVAEQMGRKVVKYEMKFEVFIVNASTLGLPQVKVPVAKRPKGVSKNLG